ncbi:MAG TPA: 5-(carboxyamino)imidazole ribonucleotide mutase [Gammaproteobacteria bacterium]|nr:5-(carboxyamino)imidazole ribonucleotide mutase [Gammaproteobacteria bacterium]
MNQRFVAILMGSDSDLSTMQTAMDTLDALGIPWEVKITSSHRTPDATRNYVREADQRGCQVFIAAAGLAAHLAGTVASLTLKPVIGVPIEAGPLRGEDALLSTVQMPGGIPVACVAIGKAGSRNAAYLAAQMLALQDPGITTLLATDRKQNAQDVADRDTKLRQHLGKSSIH